MDIKYTCKDVEHGEGVDMLAVASCDGKEMYCSAYYKKETGLTEEFKQMAEKELTKLCTSTHTNKQ